MGSTTEPERFGKVRPLGSKGSNPLQVLCIQVGLLIRLSDDDARSRNVTSQTTD